LPRTFQAVTGKIGPSEFRVPDMIFPREFRVQDMIFPSMFEKWDALYLDERVELLPRPLRRRSVGSREIRASEVAS
jgi:hypothetical protein